MEGWRVGCYQEGCLWRVIGRLVDEDFVLVANLYSLPQF